MIDDVRGLGLSTTNADAASLYGDAVRDYLDYRGSAFPKLKSAIEADPEFVMALCFRACFFQMMETTAIRPRVQGWIDEMQPLLDGVTDRERLHVQAVQLWVSGDILGATNTWELILADHPLDIVALKLHHYLTFWTGRTQALRAATASVLPAWNDTTPGYASVLGMHAFALEETGNHVQAEAWGREAVERNPNDLWAIHSVAHVLETQGRSAEGVEWLDYPADVWATTIRSVRSTPNRMLTFRTWRRCSPGWSYAAWTSATDGRRSQSTARLASATTRLRSTICTGAWPWHRREILRRRTNTPTRSLPMQRRAPTGMPMSSARSVPICAEAWRPTVRGTSARLQTCCGRSRMTWPRLAEATPSGICSRRFWAMRCSKLNALVRPEACTQSVSPCDPQRAPTGRTWLAP